MEDGRVPPPTIVAGGKQKRSISAAPAPPPPRSRWGAIVPESAAKPTLVPLTTNGIGDGRKLEAEAEQGVGSRGGVNHVDVGHGNLDIRAANAGRWRDVGADTRGRLPKPVLTGNWQSCGRGEAQTSIRKATEPGTTGTMGAP